VQSKNRDRDFPSVPGNRQLADKLPDWMTSRKHRDEVLRAIGHLRATPLASRRHSRTLAQTTSSTLVLQSRGVCDRSFPPLDRAGVRSDLRVGRRILGAERRPPVRVRRDPRWRPPATRRVRVSTARDAARHDERGGARGTAEDLAAQDVGAALLRDPVRTSSETLAHSTVRWTVYACDG
jgi:hypothetical protein